MAVVAERALANLRAVGLSDVLHLQDYEAYDARIASYWSLTAQLRSWAIVQPRNTEEVAKAVRALVDSPDVKFAVRSGGHMSWAGASNIVNGITIDLGLMKGTSYDPETQIASLKPGGTWAKVYTESEKYGRMVAGGREGTVGIGGLVDWWRQDVLYLPSWVRVRSSTMKFVLADGGIVDANSKTNPDLFRVLKGGGNNFGIVTRFDMATFPARDIWDCTLVCPKESMVEVAQALVDFTDNLTAHPNGHVLAMWTYMPKTKDHFILMLMMNLDGEEEPHTLRKFLSIPGQKDSKVTTVATKLESFFVPSGKQDKWFSLAFKSDLRII